MSCGGQYRNFQREADFFKQWYSAEQKNLVRQQVNEAIAYTRYKRKSTQRLLKNNIQPRVYEVWGITPHLYAVYPGPITRFCVESGLSE